MLPHCVEAPSGVRDHSNSARAATTWSVERKRERKQLETMPVTVTSMAHALVCRDDWEGTVSELQGHFP